MANILTGLRILLSVALLFFSPTSAWFYVLYLCAGISDMLDGFIARRTKTESDFGAKLDSIADLVFIVCALIKIFPLLSLDAWAYWWAGTIALIKIVAWIIALVRFKKWDTFHTILNKVTGLLLFIWPLTLELVPQKYSVLVVLVVASVATLNDLRLLNCKT